MLTEGHVLDGPGVIPDAWMRNNGLGFDGGYHFSGWYLDILEIEMYTLFLVGTRSFIRKGFAFFGKESHVLRQKRCQDLDYLCDLFVHFSIHGYGCWKCFRRYSEHLFTCCFFHFSVCFPWPFKSFLSFLPKQERLLHDLGEGPGEFATPESPDCSMEGSPRSVNPQGKILDFVKKEGLLRMLRICFIWFWLKEISGTLKKWTHISTVHIQSTYSKYFIPIFVAAIHFPMVHLIFETIIFVGDFPMLSWRYWSLESLLGSLPIHNVAPLLTGEEVGIYKSLDF